MFFGFYYTLLTLVWLPWATAINWGVFVSSNAAYFMGGLLSMFLTLTWALEQEEKAQAFFLILRLFNTYCKTDIMKKITLTYEEIELMQFLLNKFGLEEWWISESMWENIDALKLKLTAMRAQMEYIKQRES